MLEIESNKHYLKVLNKILFGSVSSEINFIKDMRTCTPKYVHGSFMGNYCSLISFFALLALKCHSV